VGAEEVEAAYDPDKTLTPGDTVRLIWQGRIATVAFRLTAYLPPAPVSAPTTAPPPATTSGTLTVMATDSATWTSTLGYWNVWAAKNQTVHQGSASGHTTTGSWFYNGATKQLAGAEVKRIQFRVPKRLSAGAYNSPAVMHLYVHNNDTRPGSDVTRVHGPFDITVPPQGQGGFVDISGALMGLFAGVLVNGGGFSIAGDPYMGFVGKAEDPSSGQLLIDWQR
jgi:hypothetical protein